MSILPEDTFPDQLAFTIDNLIGQTQSGHHTGNDKGDEDANGSVEGSGAR
jgi:hypothetical protein